jgi:transposase InsO family protein
VAVEYFTKWIEVNLLVNKAAAGLKRFFWQNIICCFGVPKEITVDNGKQFNCHIFKDFCRQMGVKAAFASVYHSQSNGAMEKANALIFISIKYTRESAERQMGRRIIESYMEPQYFCLQSYKIHPFQVAVWRRTSSTRGNQASQRQNKDGGHLQS